jgi:hypothetical protein
MFFGGRLAETGLHALSMAEKLSQKVAPQKMVRRIDVHH